MMAVVQTGSRTFRSACATKRRVCRLFWAWTDGAPRVMAAAAAAAPRTTCRRLMRSILEFLQTRGGDSAPGSADRALGTRGCCGSHRLEVSIAPLVEILVRIAHGVGLGAPQHHLEIDRREALVLVTVDHA